MNIVREEDVQADTLRSRRIAMIGYGSQGRPQSLNLRDSALDVVVGLRPESPSRAKAEADGVTVGTIAEAVQQSDVVMLMLPDEEQPAVFARDVQPHLRPGSYLGFAHGFAIHFKCLEPDPAINVFLVAPKGVGRMVRRQYLAGAGVPCLYAVHQDPSGDTRGVALAYACGLGGGRAGIMETTFREETETDLFSEQVILCGGMVELIRAGFETLVNAGYAPEVAYFECLHEVKLIADLVHERGITGMRAAISNTAEFGGLTRGPRIIGADAREAMRTILAEIQGGAFAREWLAECAAGRARMIAQTTEEAGHAIEEVGGRLRGLMPWLGSTARDGE